jgi:hypothetical protein
MRSFLLAFVGGMSALHLAGCGPFGDDGGKGGGKSIPSSLTLMSSSLSNPKLGKVGAVEKRFAIRADSTTPIPHPDVVDSSFYLSYRLTPDNIEGRLIQAALMVGQSGPAGGSAIFLAAQDENGYNHPTVPRSQDLPLFNLSQRLSMGEEFKCCWESYPSAERAYSAWLEIMFAYVDIRFTLPEGALKGSHNLRIAYADIDDLGYRRGDFLYQTAEGWKWVDSVTGAFVATRPSHPVQMGAVTSYRGSSDGRGNQTIPTLFIAIQDSQKVHMPADTVLSHSWEFIVDFILNQGIIVRRVDPAKATSMAELLGAFDIRADRDNTNGNGDGLTCNFYALHTPLEKPRPNDFKDSLDHWIKPPPDDSTK